MSTETMILDELKALAAHYPRRQMGQADLARWFEDYIRDITGAGFDESDIRIACTNWRTSDAKKMPTPGELLAYCRKVFRRPDPNAAIIPIPQAVRPQYSDEHKALMRAKLGGLVGEMAARQKNYRRFGENDAAYAERVWPARRIDRMRRREAI